MNQSSHRRVHNGNAMPKSRPATTRWDIAVAALACATMTTGFWRAFPDMVGIDAPSATAILIKSAMASLGFVAIASQWERALQTASRDPVGILIVLLACFSGIWAISPADTLRDGLMLLVIWGFGLGLALRFTNRDLSEIFAFAALLGLAAQFAAAKTVPSLEAMDGDLVFALASFAWAAYSVPARRLLWLAAFAVGLLWAWTGQDAATLGLVLGGVLGAGVAWTRQNLRTNGGVSVLRMAWLLVGLIAALTLYLLFGAAQSLESLEKLLSELGPNWAAGYGFGYGGTSVSQALGVGLGIAGLIVGLMFLLVGLMRLVLAARPKAFLPVIWFGCIGAVLFAPGSIDITGSLIVLMLASSFQLTAAPVRKSVRRRLLAPVPDLQIQPRPVAQSQLNVPPTQRPVGEVDSEGPKLSALGLRSKI